MLYLPDMKEKERSCPINLLDEMRAEYKTAEFVFKDQTVVRINLEGLRSIEELLHSLKIKPNLMRYYPIDRRPYIEFDSMPDNDSQKIYIHKVE